MDSFMRDLLGTAWAYYVAISIALLWFVVEKLHSKKK